MRKHTLICDTCKVEVVQEKAVNWLEVSFPDGTIASFQGQYPPEYYGLFCSETCHARAVEKYRQRVTGQPKVTAIEIQDNGDFVFTVDDFRV